MGGVKIMKFKDTNNNVHEIDDGYEGLLPAGSVEISDAEADALLTLTSGQIDAALDAEAEQALNVSLREKVLLKQIFLLRKVNTPSLTQSQFLNELKTDYKAFK